MARDFDADDLFFAGVVARAERMALLAILAAVAGGEVIDLFYARRKCELEGLFLSLEDGNPALAARLHARLESARASLADDRL